MLKEKTEFQKMLISEEEKKRELIKSFTLDLLQEVDKIVESKGQEELLNLIK